MPDQPQKYSSPAQSPATMEMQAAFAARPTIGRVNWAGMSALYMKEVRRFIKVQLQTIWAPAMTTLLYLIIFTVALGRGDFQMLGVNLATFLAPGLIAMAMMTNSFANSSFSVLVGKLQGTIVDYLMPPLSELELLLALVGAAVTRALLVGGAIFAVMLFWPDVQLHIAHFWAVVLFGVLAAAMLGFMGLLTSIWAEKFDHAAAITNFVVLPLSLLSGTFYTIDRLNPGFATVMQANPFHYAISGFRYGFIGSADIHISSGIAILLGFNLLLGLVCYLLLRSGWKLKP